MSEQTIELQGTIEETLPDSGIYVRQQENGRLIYFNSFNPMRLYTKWRGKEIDAELPFKECISFTVSENSIYKAVFIPPAYFEISFIQYKFGNLPAQLFGECLMEICGKTYAYRISDKPDKKYLLIDLSDQELNGLHLLAIYRETAIYCKYNEDSNEESLSILIRSANILVLGVFNTNRLASYYTDSSPIILFAYGRKIIAFHFDEMRFILPLHIDHNCYISSIVGLFKGKITLRVEKPDDTNCYLMTATLPQEYYTETSIANNAQVTDNLSEKEFALLAGAIENQLLNTSKALYRKFKSTEYRNPAENANDMIAEIMRFREPLNRIHTSLILLSENCGATVPILLREDHINQKAIATVRCDYRSTLSFVKAGDNVILLENSNPRKWKIQSLNGKHQTVPMWIFFPPIPAFRNMEMKRLQKLFDKMFKIIELDEWVLKCHKLIKNIRVMYQVQEFKNKHGGAHAVQLMRNPLAYHGFFTNTNENLNYLRLRLPSNDEHFLRLCEEVQKVVEMIWTMHEEEATPPSDQLKELLDRLMINAQSTINSFNERKGVTSSPETGAPFLQVNTNLSFEAVHSKREEEGIEFVSKFSKEYSVNSIKGEGGFGCVFEAFNKLDNCVYAVKRVAVNYDQMEGALREVRAMAKLDHSGIVHYNFSWIEEPPEGWQRSTDDAMLKDMKLPRNHLRSAMNNSDNCVFIYIQMQLCNYSLSEWLKNNTEATSRNLPRMKFWFKQIAEAVAYIHRNNIIHRDLKPSNILFLENDMLKLCDLGIATHRCNEEETDSTIIRTNLGTMLYMSPEQRFNKPYSSKTDVFSLGLILAEIVSVIGGARRTEVFDKYRLGVQSNLINDPATANFVRILTQVDPNDRPTSEDLLSHLFLA